MQSERKLRLVFISNMAAPYQVRFCAALQKYLTAEFWFHVAVERGRPQWWKVDLGRNCHLLRRVLFKRSRRYLSLEVFKRLRAFDPDIVMLGGFTYPTNYLAYWWARRHHKMAVLVTEVYRGRRRIYVRGKGLAHVVLRLLYPKLDLVVAVSAEAANQFRDVFGFEGRVVECNYAADIDSHLSHQLRKDTTAPMFLFANRLVAMYNPVFAIRVFAEVVSQRPGPRLLMNGEGELRRSCEEAIRALELTGSVEFLDAISSWEQLPEIYERCHVLLLPATFSAGNFTVVEAMASGMGIIVSDKVLGTGTSLITDGVNGFVCELEVMAFVRAALAYASEGGVLSAHGAVNKERARHWSPAVTAEHLVRILDEGMRVRASAGRRGP